MDNFFQTFQQREVQTRSADDNAPQHAKPPKGGNQVGGERPSPVWSLVVLIPTWTVCDSSCRRWGQMVTQYQRMNGEGGNFIEGPLRQERHPELYAPGAPEPADDASQMQEANRVPQDILRNAYVYIERNDGYPVNLWLHGWRLRPTEQQ